MKDNRPVNLDLSTIQFPLTATVSILHRVSGVFIFAGIAVLLYALDCSLDSQQGFAEIQTLLQNTVVKLIIWAVVAGLIYHTVAGIKHLIMDIGIGETLEGGMLGAKLTLGIAAILIVLAGVWIW